MQLSWKDDCVEMVDAGRADCLERCLVQEACWRLPRNCFHCERCHRFFVSVYFLHIRRLTSAAVLSASSNKWPWP
jgi:hypothetical protein